MGIFTSAGTGKTMLNEYMIIHFAQADIFIIGLIGEQEEKLQSLLKN